MIDTLTSANPGIRDLIEDVKKDQLKQVRHAILLVRPKRPHGGPPPIGLQRLLLITRIRDIHIWAPRSATLSISQSICQEPVMTTFSTSAGLCIA